MPILYPVLDGRNEFLICFAIRQQQNDRKTSEFAIQTRNTSTARIKAITKSKTFHSTYKYLYLFVVFHWPNIDWIDWVSRHLKSKRKTSVANVQRNDPHFALHFGGNFCGNWGNGTFENQFSASPTYFQHLIHILPLLQSFKPRNFHGIKQNVADLPKIIEKLLKHEEYFNLLQPYIDDYFEKLEYEVISGLNADKLKAISLLPKKSRQTHLIAKAGVLHRFREGVVHMEFAYAKSYQLFVRGMDVALKIKTRKASGRVKGAIGAKGKRQLPKKSVLAQPNPHAHQQRIDEVLKLVNLFEKRYTDEYNKIRGQLFARVKS